MVTFKRIDPLFVIDLSDPTNPGILGKLKIPGYSDYLHPYDQDHIIGVGKETESNEWGGVSTSGLKLALFDVSDVNHPSEVDHVEIGDAGRIRGPPGSQGLPLLKGEGSPRHSGEGGAESSPEGRLLAVYPEGLAGRLRLLRLPVERVHPEGKVTHSSEDSQGYYWGSRDAVKRSLYIGDVLYTLSSAEIIATDLKAMTLIREIPLPFAGYGYQYSVPMVE